MKRTILVLTLTLLLSSATPARAGSLDDGDLSIPAPARSSAVPVIASSPVSDSNDPSNRYLGNASSLTSSDNGIPVGSTDDANLQAPSPTGNSIWDLILGLLSFGF
jgi:hypothetical protein